MAQTIQRSFTGGEISPSLRSRADLTKYATGLALCQNMIVRPQGGVYSRQGLRFIGEVAASSEAVRLVSFSFNTTDTYVLVFQRQRIRFIRNGAFVTTGSPATIYEITTSYGESDLSDLAFTQSADTLTICHRSHLPADLTRSDHDDWSLNAINFNPSVSRPDWRLANPLVLFGDGAGDFDRAYSYVITALNGNGEESIASAERSITGPSRSTTAGVRLHWQTVTDAIRYRIYKAASNNSGIFGFIGESTTTTFEDYNIAPLTSEAPPENRFPFGGGGNQPGAVNYFQQRLIFANTTNQPQTVYTTQTGLFRSLRTSSPTRATDAVTFTVVGRQVNEIRHILSLDTLLLLTSGGEWRVTEGRDQVLTPSTVGVRIQSYNGASKVPPAVINSTALYVQEKGSRIRDLGYEFNSDKYTGNDLSIMAEHLFEGFTVREMAYAEEPYGILWVVRSDGVLLGLTYKREQQVWAWHQHTTDGAFESVTTISEDGRDAVYVVVRRTIEGVTRRYVERFEVRDVSAPENVFCVDSGLTYEGAPVTMLTGLNHLEGKAVAVVSDGNEVSGLTVTSGAIQLPRAASKVSVGLPFTPAIETLDVDVASSEETVKGKTISVSQVVLEVERSRGGFISPIKDDDTANQTLEIKPRFQSDGYGPIALKTFKQTVNITNQWSLGGRLRIEQRSPFPLAILSIIPDVDVGGH